MGFWDWLGLGSQGGADSTFDQYLKYSDSVGTLARDYVTSTEGRGYNPYIQDINRPYNGMDARLAEFRNSVNRLRAIGDEMPGQLRRSALASTQGAAVSATAAARAASGGRGGLAFGGGGAAYAARAGLGAGVEQSSMLAQALANAGSFRLSAEQAATGVESTAAQLELSLAGARQQGITSQAQLAESYRQSADAYRLAHLQGLLGLAGGGLYAGAQGEQAIAARRSGLVTSFAG